MGPEPGSSSVQTLDADAVSQLASAWPLPFFLAFEAWKDGQGVRFGPFGSSIIATTLAPLLAPLKDLDDPDLLPDVDNMPALVAHIESPKEPIPIEESVPTV